MSRKTKTVAAADKAAQPQFSAAALEQLIPGPVTPTELENIFQQFKKAVLERASGAEISHHLGYAFRHLGLSVGLKLPNRFP